MDLCSPGACSRLPNPNDDNGLHQILSSGSSVMLTAMPTRRDRQPIQSQPACLSRSDYRDVVQNQDDHSFLSGAIDVRPTLVEDALAPVWATATLHEFIIKGFVLDTFTRLGLAVGVASWLS